MVNSWSPDFLNKCVLMLGVYFLPHMGILGKIVQTLWSFECQEMLKMSQIRAFDGNWLGQLTGSERKLPFNGLKIRPPWPEQECSMITLSPDLTSSNLKKHFNLKYLESFSWEENERGGYREDDCPKHYPLAALIHLHGEKMTNLTLLLCRTSGCWRWPNVMKRNWNSFGSALATIDYDRIMPRLEEVKICIHTGCCLQDTKLGRPDLDWEADWRQCDQ